jgi:hypothetical protein
LRRLPPTAPGVRRLRACHDAPSVAGLGIAAR